MDNLVLYGGTFDPIHNGHIRIARAASLRLNADVVFIPNKKPRWKETHVSDKDRLKMLKLALKQEGNMAFSISMCELKRKGDVTYTVDTVINMARRHKNQHLILLIGADQVNNFHKWKFPDLICQYADIIYVERPGVELDQKNIERFKMKSLGFTESGEVSSRAVRALTYMDLSSSVLEYIEKKHLYFMEDVEQYISGHRLNHSISVANLAYSIAICNKIENPGRAFIAGLLHDIGKKYPDSKAREIMKNDFPEYYDYPPITWHQFVGAYLAKNEFNIQDESILDAIMYHCTGKAKMSVLAKIIYASDKIDPYRGWDSSKYITLCQKDCDEGFKQVLFANKEYLIKNTGDKCMSIYLTKQCFDYYLGGNVEIWPIQNM